MLKVWWAMIYEYIRRLCDTLLSSKDVVIKTHAYAPDCDPTEVIGRSAHILGSDEQASRLRDSSGNTPGKASRPRARMGSEQVCYL